MCYAEKYVSSALGVVTNVSSAGRSSKTEINQSSVTPSLMILRCKLGRNIYILCSILA